MPIILDLAAGLVPGALLWWLANWVLRSPPERVVERLALFRSLHGATLGFIGILATNLGRPLAFLLVLISSSAAWYPLERALFSGPEGLLRSIAGRIRRITAYVVFSALHYLTTLAVILDGSPGVAVVALALHALFIWKGVSFTLLLVGARPLEDPILCAALGEVESRLATGSIPTTLVTSRAVDPLPNAFFIALPTRSLVLLGRSLLDALTPAEAAAVHAHELSHLEQYDAARMRQRLQLGLFRLALAVVPLVTVLLTTAPGFRAPAFVIGLFGCLLADHLLRRNSRIDEESADRRAVVLSGNPDALVSALLKLHDLNRIPHQLDAAADTLATHPSLARRVQAIRHAAGLVGQAMESPTRLAFVLRAEEVGVRIAFDPAGVTVLAGLPDAAPDDHAALMAVAHQRTTTRWDQLCEVSWIPSRPPKLVLRHVDGTLQAFRLPPDTADPRAQLGPWLDALGPIPPDLGKRTLARLFSGLALLSAIAGQSPSLGLVALAGIRRTDASSLRALVTTCWLQLGFVLPAVLMLPPAQRQGTLPFLALFGPFLVGLLGVGLVPSIRRDTLPALRTHTAWVTGVGALLLLLPALLDPPADAFGLWWTLRESRETGFLLLATAAALTGAARIRPARLALVAAIGTAFVVGGTALARDHLVQDPLLPAPTTRPYAVRPPPNGTGQPLLPTDAQLESVSPDGQSWLATTTSGAEDTQLYFGTDTVALPLEAASLGAFVGDSELITAGNDSRGVVLRLWTLGSAAPVLTRERVTNVLRVEWGARLGVHGTHFQLLPVWAPIADLTGDVTLTGEIQRRRIGGRREPRDQWTCGPACSGSAVRTTASNTAWTWSIRAAFGRWGDHGIEYRLEQGNGPERSISTGASHVAALPVGEDVVLVTDFGDGRAAFRWDASGPTPLVGLPSDSWPIRAHASGWLTAVRSTHDEVLFVDTRETPPQLLSLQYGPGSSLQDAIAHPGGLHLLWCTATSCLVDHVRRLPDDHAPLPSATVPTP